MSISTCALYSPRGELVPDDEWVVFSWTIRETPSQWVTTVHQVAGLIALVTLAQGQIDRVAKASIYVKRSTLNRMHFYGALTLAAFMLATALLLLAFIASSSY